MTLRYTRNSINVVRSRPEIIAMRMLHYLSSSTTENTIAMTFPIRKILSATIVILLVSSGAYSQTALEGEKLFNEKCIACHTLG